MTFPFTIAILSHIYCYIPNLSRGDVEVLLVCKKLMFDMKQLVIVYIVSIRIL